MSVLKFCKGVRLKFSISLTLVKLKLIIMTDCGCSLFLLNLKERNILFLKKI